MESAPHALAEDLRETELRRRRYLIFSEEANDPKGWIRELRGERKERSPLY